MYVNYAAYRNGQVLGSITIDEISDVLLEPDTFVWLALSEPDAVELGKIQEEFGLHDLAIEDARSAHQRPKLEEYGDSLFVALHTVALNGDRVQYGETHVFVGKQFLISIRRGSTASYRRVRERCENNPQLLAKGPGVALYALLDFVVDQYLLVSDHYEQRLERLEDDIFENRLDRPLIGRLYELKREVSELRTAAAPIVEIANALMRRHREIVAPDLRDYYRDVHDHVLRVLRATDTMRETLADAMQVNLALVTVRQNEVVKRLAGWGAILALPTMVFSMYGMNFKTMPELDWQFGYPASLAVTLVGCIWLYRLLKRARWL
jgi:magnesium transporter